MLHNPQPRTCMVASATVLMFFLLISTMSKVLASGWVDGNPPTYNGVPVKGQCVAFVDNYADQVLGCHIPPVGLYDADLFAHWIWDDSRLQPANTDRIANDGTNYPQPQDIVVWSKNLPGSGGAGHIAIVDVSNSKSDIIVVDSNWSEDEKGQRHQISSTLGYVLGWFRKKGTTGGSVDPANPYVDGSYGGTQIGTAANPFKTVAQAISAASTTQATIHIKPGTYGEKVSTSKHILFVTWGSGTVKIGG